MSNIAQAVWDRASSDPGRLALRGDSEPWTFECLRDRAAAVASQLVTAGVRPGDRVLLVAPSVPEFAGAYIGILAAGGIAVTANTMSTRRELEYLGSDAGATVVMGWSEVRPAPEEAAAALGIAYWPLADELADFADAPFAAPHPRADDDTAVILYTSGTTGRPKGAQLTHGNFTACAEIFTGVLEAGPEDRFGTALPLFHVFGQAVVMGTALRTGASLSLLSRFDAAALLDMIRRDGLTVVFGVPTMWNALLHSTEGAGAEDFASLRLVASGGASLPTEILRGFEERFGCVILEGYGLTETTSGVTFNGLRRARKPASAGIAIPRCEIEVRDDDGARVPAGAVGEVHVRGPVVMKGYWNRPDATAETLVDGWLRTGDLGMLDEDGDLRIVDRRKDLIIRGGYNVYPSEVEEVLYEHPDIVEAAVVGVPDEHLGEEVAAALALRPGAVLDPVALRAWAKERLSAYKVPRLWVSVDELPKGPTGKILKRAIDRDAIRAQAEQAVARATR